MTPLLQDLSALPCDFQQLRELGRRSEAEAVAALLPQVELEAPEAVTALATRMVESARAHRSPAFNEFLATWRLSTEEGRALLTLAEALLRIPDKDSANRLVNDLVTRGNWHRDIRSGSTLVHMASLGLSFSKRFIQDARPDADDGLAGTWQTLVLKLGDALFRRAIEAALQFLATQFVLGEDMPQALARRKPELRYSFDRLGEAAQTADDTKVYFQAYRNAIEALAGQGETLPLLARDGISIKLSALHPRFEYAKWDRLERELLPRLRTLAEVAAEAGIPITLDAEESERLEITLAIYSEMARLPALQHWGGLGLAVQAYQKRAPAALDLLGRIAAEFRHPVPVRLVKGAYWDTEIKRAQQLGLADYPVYTRKAHTDLAYLACARRLLAHRDVFFPQFATHNAHTLAWVETCAQQLGADYEVQKLVGMGDEVHAAFHAATGRPLRVYAPVGNFNTLLPYLVRRLLENGSSQSFVNQLADKTVPAATLVQDPLLRLERPPAPHPRLPAPRAIFPDRPGAPGFDPADVDTLQYLKGHLPRFSPVAASALTVGEHSIKVVVEKRYSPARPAALLGSLRPATPLEVGQAFVQARAAFAPWSRRPASERADLLRRLAEQLLGARDELLGLLIREGGKTLMDALAEWREAVDFCHYYALQAERLCQPEELPGVSGERNRLEWQGRGVYVCLSPWNFPLSIFLGQVLAALAAGNTVLAKPASQTPLVAFRAVELAHAAGIPPDVLQFLPGASSTLGPELLGHPLLAGIAFTGSAEVAAEISRQLAQRSGSRVPLIAETGGLNALIADSSALPEQLVADIMASAYTSAGQRCSALRVLWLQEDICARVLDRLQGALDEWEVGDPARFGTDMGPVIDAAAQSQLETAIESLAAKAQRQLQGRVTAGPDGHFLAPRAFLLARDELPRREIFGPVLAIATWRSDELEQVVDWVNATGYGLTLGVHSRIQSTLDYVSQQARVGNIYLNRNQIGAVVGSQPFGGEGLSGTGFKAGGPHYLLRFMTERVVTTNLSALGVNTMLIDLEE